MTTFQNKVVVRGLSSCAQSAVKLLVFNLLKQCFISYRAQKHSLLPSSVILFTPGLWTAPWPGMPHISSRISPPEENLYLESPLSFHTGSPRPGTQWRRDVVCPNHLSPPIPHLKQNLYKAFPVSSHQPWANTWMQTNKFRGMDTHTARDSDQSMKYLFVCECIHFYNKYFT